MNIVKAELKAIRDYEVLKKAGLITSSPSPVVAKTKAKALMPKPRSTPTTRPNVTYTTTPRARPRIGKKLCTSYKKTELIEIMRRLGRRVDPSDTVARMCAKLKKAPVTVKGGAYTRPLGVSFVNVRKETYESHVRNKLYKLAKNVGIKVLSKDKKGEIISKIRAKLNKNVEEVLKGMNISTVTARQISEKLAKNYGWKNDRHVERVRLLKIYGNKR
jgi:hypothetical protein